jgi:hypothetical protein
LFISVPLVGCTAEGNSQYLGKGETQYYLNMRTCEKEAQSEYTSGGRKYSGYECRKMLFGIFQLESKTFDSPNSGEIRK